MVGAALHGIIRAGQAVRSMGQDETPLRRNELAQGFAYWAARYYELPSAAAVNGSLMPSSAARQLALMPPERRQNFGLITKGLLALKDEPDFPSVINAVDARGNASAFLSDLTRTFAGVLRSNAGDFGTAIAFVHSVTGPSAIRLLLPYVDDADAPELLRHGWQAAAALYTTFGVCPADESDGEAVEVDDLIDRAIATGDEHAIKFTEACLREHAVEPQSVFLAAAQHTTSILDRRN
jgi:hypothetical protein